MIKKLRNGRDHRDGPWTVTSIAGFIGYMALKIGHPNSEGLSSCLIFSTQVAHLIFRYPPFLDKTIFLIPIPVKWYTFLTMIPIDSDILCLWAFGMAFQHVEICRSEDGFSAVQVHRA